MEELFGSENNQAPETSNNQDESKEQESNDKIDYNDVE